jgi:hypothetical protein
MSQENVEMLRAAYESFNIGKQFDAARLTADVEFTTQRPDGEVVYHGPEGVARGIRGPEE